MKGTFLPKLASETGTATDRLGAVASSYLKQSMEAQALLLLGRTYLGMGEDDINLHDQWAVESMGAIQDRTREHLGTSDKVIMANRRALLKAIETVRAGGKAPMVLDAAAAAALVGPDTIDCIAPADRWAAYWQEQVAAKRAGARWLQREGESLPTSAGA